MMNSNYILLNALGYPEVARGSYFRKQQQDSGFTVRAFIATMVQTVEGLVYLFYNSASAKTGADISTISLPMYFVAPPLMGHFMTSDLYDLVAAIGEEFNAEDPQRGTNPGGLSHAELATYLFYTMQPENFFGLTPTIQKEVGIYKKNLEKAINGLKNPKIKLRDKLKAKTIRKIIPLIKNSEGKLRAEKDLKEIE